MSSSNDIRKQAAKHGLRELCTDAIPADGVIFTHLETDDGTRYRLVNPMTARDLVFAAEAKQHLLIVIPESERVMASVSVYATARVIEYYDETSHVVAKWFGTGAGEFSRPWIQTQNQKYWLVPKS